MNITAEKQLVYQFYHALDREVLVGLIIEDGQPFCITKIARPNPTRDYIAMVRPIVAQGEEAKPREISLKYDATVFAIKIDLNSHVGNNFKQQGWEE